MSTTTKKAAAVEGTVVPDGVKAPQDHKPKAEPAPETVSVTVRDREWTVPADAMNDFELLDDINELELHNNAARLTSLLRRLIGDQWREAMDTLRDETTGRVSIEAGTEFVLELVGALNPNS